MDDCARSRHETAAAAATTSKLRHSITARPRPRPSGGQLVASLLIKPRCSQDCQCSSLAVTESGEVERHEAERHEVGELRARSDPRRERRLGVGVMRGRCRVLQCTCVKSKPRIRFCWSRAIGRGLKC